MTKRKFLGTINTTTGYKTCRDLKTGETYYAANEQILKPREVDGRKFATVELTVVGPLAWNVRKEMREVEILPDATYDELLPPQLEDDGKFLHRWNTMKNYLTEQMQYYEDHDDRGLISFHEVLHLMQRIEDMDEEEQTNE